MGIKTSELLALNGAINMLFMTNVSAKPKFSYALSITQKKLAPIVEAFEKARKELIDQYAKRDENNQMVMTGEGQEQAVTLTDPVAFRAAEVSLLEEEVDFQPHRVMMSHLPETLGAAIVNGLLPMLIDDEPEPANLNPAPREIARPTPVVGDTPVGHA